MPDTLSVKREAGRSEWSVNYETLRERERERSKANDTSIELMVTHNFLGISRQNL